MVNLERNMQSFLNLKHVVVFDGTITIWFKFINTAGFPL